MSSRIRLSSLWHLCVPLLGLAFVVLDTAASPLSAAPLEIQVFQTSESSLYADMTLIKGEKNAILVDAPFTRADAYRLVAAILESGKTLDTVIITHDHPDHYFSLEVITDAFPNARAVASPQVVDDIWKSIPHKLKRWGAMLGANGPRHPTAPAALEQPYIELEGHRIEILGPMQGDHAHSTAVWVPDAKTLVAGDLLFNQVHLWLGETTPTARLAWIESVNRLAALGAVTIVAGHKRPGLADDVGSLTFTKNYLETFNREIARSKKSEDLIARIRKEFPDTIDVLDNFILPNSAKVAMGEMPIWDE
jgi:glyoxylase-like metal-dependent hydrolase (beta-lactamase superfamily II)